MPRGVGNQPRDRNSRGTMNEKERRTTRMEVMDTDTGTNLNNRQPQVSHALCLKIVRLDSIQLLTAGLLLWTSQVEAVWTSSSGLNGMWVIGRFHFSVSSTHGH
jgi:hypothetical protein